MPLTRPHGVVRRTLSLLSPHRLASPERLIEENHDHRDHLLPPHGAMDRRAPRRRQRGPPLPAAGVRGRSHGRGHPRRLPHAGLRGAARAVGRVLARPRPLPRRPRRGDGRSGRVARGRLVRRTRGRPGHRGARVPGPTPGPLRSAAPDHPVHAGGRPGHREGHAPGGAADRPRGGERLLHPAPARGCTSSPTPRRPAGSSTPRPSTTRASSPGPSATRGSREARATRSVRAGADSPAAPR